MPVVVAGVDELGLSLLFLSRDMEEVVELDLEGFAIEKDMLRSQGIMVEADRVKISNSSEDTKTDTVDVFLESLP
jgi:hypothetical protein